MNQYSSGKTKRFLRPLFGFWMFLVCAIAFVMVSFGWGIAPRPMLNLRDGNGERERERSIHHDYPLVNSHVTMERSTIFNGTTHYFAIFQFAFCMFTRPGNHTIR